MVRAPILLLRRIYSRLCLLQCLCFVFNCPIFDLIFMLLLQIACSKRFTFHETKSSASCWTFFVNTCLFSVAVYSNNSSHPLLLTLIRINNRRTKLLISMYKLIDRTRPGLPSKRWVIYSCQQFLIWNKSLYNNNATTRLSTHFNDSNHFQDPVLSYSSQTRVRCRVSFFILHQGVMCLIVCWYAISGLKSSTGPLWKPPNWNLGCVLSTLAWLCAE